MIDNRDGNRSRLLFELQTRHFFDRFEQSHTRGVLRTQLDEGRPAYREVPTSADSCQVDDRMNGIRRWPVEWPSQVLLSAGDGAASIRGRRHVELYMTATMACLGRTPAGGDMLCPRDPLPGHRM